MDVRPPDFRDESPFEHDVRLQRPRVLHFLLLHSLKKNPTEAQEASTQQSRTQPTSRVAFVPGATKLNAEKGHAPLCRWQ